MGGLGLFCIIQSFLASWKIWMTVWIWRTSSWDSQLMVPWSLLSSYIAFAISNWTIGFLFGNCACLELFNGIPTDLWCLLYSGVTPLFNSFSFLLQPSANLFQLELKNIKHQNRPEVPIMTGLCHEMSLFLTHCWVDFLVQYPSTSTSQIYHCHPIYIIGKIMPKICPKAVLCH